MNELKAIPRGDEARAGPAPTRLRPSGSRDQLSVHSSSHDPSVSPLLPAWQGVSEGPASPLCPSETPVSASGVPGPVAGAGIR